MKDMMSAILEGSLDGEMDEELGYSKYDFRNKETDNSSMDIIQNHYIPVMAIWNWMFPVTEIIGKACNKNLSAAVSCHPHGL